MEEFDQVLSAIADELPREFYRELSGGIQLDPGIKIHPEAVANDLFIMGQYIRDNLGKRIVIYYGSFVRSFSHLSDEALNQEIRRILLHEFRHHLEGLAGERDLEIEDAIHMYQYKRMHGLLP